MNEELIKKLLSKNESAEVVNLKWSGFTLIICPFDMGCKFGLIPNSMEISEDQLLFFTIDDKKEYRLFKKTLDAQFKIGRSKQFQKKMDAMMEGKEAMAMFESQFFSDDF